MVANTIQHNQQLSLTRTNTTSYNQTLHPHIIRTDRNNSNQLLVTQSVQSSSNLRNLENSQVGIGVVAVQRGDSNSNVKQIVFSKERNCKTSSPTHQFGVESRIRKKSREMVQKNKEGFIDLLIVLGLKYNEFIESRRVIPQVVDSHPSLTNKEFAKEHNYVDNLIWICFPEGYKVQAYEKRKEGELCQMQIFHFIITNQDGLKKYITSISFKVFLYIIIFEIGTLPFGAQRCLYCTEIYMCSLIQAYILPSKVRLQFSDSFQVLNLLKRQLLTLIFQKVILQHNSLSIQASYHPPANYIWQLNEMTEDQIKKNVDDFLMTRIEFYLTVIFNHIYYCEEVDNDIEIQEITEKVTPAAYQPDGTKRKRHKKKVIDQFFRYRNTKTYGFTLENYSFELLLQSLRPEKIIFLIEALLLERKIILIKDNFGDLAVIMESLISLLNPLKWTFVFITYLTPKTVECLEAPFPYIIGVSRKIWEDQCMMREFTDDIIIFDIDNQEKLNLQREELPPLPQPQATVLERSLKELLDIKERFIEILQTNAPQNLSKEKIDEYYWAYAQLRVKQSFFNFFMLTINNYIGYFRNLDDEGDLSPAKKDKKFYDKLSSFDVFDFDSYLNQFTGQNKEYMDKFVKTQCFHNFIEETYKNISPKTPIGFFKTNFEVMLEHSFKRLKKEQNKLIDLTLFNLYNPVKFSISNIFKQYKKQLLKKHGPKIKKLLQEEGDTNSLDQEDNIDLLQRQDLLEKLLLQDVEGNSKRQLSILDQINQDLITEMSGIQYEQIEMREHLKSQRSDQSQDRAKITKTVAAQSTNAFEFQQRIISGNMASMDQSQQSETKSRNYGKIVQSRSNDHAVNSFNQSAGAKPKGGLIYKNYLSMADNKNISKLHDEDHLGNSIHNGTTLTTNNGMNTQEFDMKLMMQAFGKTGNMTVKNPHGPQKQRVNSENSFLKNIGSMNKTVIVNSNQHIQRPTTTHQNQSNVKSKTTRMDQVVNQSQAVLNLSQHLKGAIANASQFKRSTQSPQIIKQQNLSVVIQDDKNGKYAEKNQKSVLKEALNRKIQYERNKHGLQLKSDDRMHSSHLNLNQSSAVFSPGALNTSSKVIDQSTQNFKNMKTQGGVPKTNIDLMNPKNKKISRNEERKIAKKRGFLGFEQHDSFYQFYSPKEELSKLAKMPILNQQSSNLLSESKDNINFSNYLRENYNSNGSDELDQLSKIHNKIVFQKRSTHHDSQYVLISNDPLATTINFQTNFIQQKPQQNQQSPSITELSSIKKQSKPAAGQRDSLDEDFCIINQSPSIEHNYQHTNASVKQQKTAQIIKNSQQIKQYHPDTLGKGQRIIQDRKLKLEYNTNSDEIDGLENRPLQMEQSLNNTQPILTKNAKLRGSESPNVMQSQNNLSFKHFKDSINQKNQVNQGKTMKQMHSGNKSPNASRMVSKTGANTKITSTFDHTNSIRTDQNKQSSQANMLSRKRSSPLITDKVSSQNTSKLGSKMSSQNNQKKESSQQQKSQYFKQRPVNGAASQKTKSTTAQPVVQIDLGLKEKLVQQPPSRLAIEQEMQSLRISPIPNLTQILGQQSQQEDKYIIGSLQKEIISSNFNSRQSEKSIGAKGNGQDPCGMFSSMSQLVEQDQMFEKAQMTMAAMGSTKANHHRHHHHHNQSGKFRNQLSNHHLVKQSSQRSSSIQNQQEIKSRASQLSINSLQRPSQLSLMADLNRQEKEMEMMASGNRNSDVLSQNEGPNNISQISILRSSPKLYNKTNTLGNSIISPQGMNNFTIQEGVGVPSIMTSQDVQQMQSLLIALKSNIPQTTLNNVNTVKIDLDRGKKIVFSPKGLGSSKTNFSSKQIDRVNSTDETARQQIKQLIIDPSHHQTPNIQLQKDKRAYIKNHVKSPQPSSQMMSSNSYLKSLHSQEFQLKEKGKTKLSQAYNTSALHQSMDPMITLHNDQRNYFSNNIHNSSKNNTANQQKKNYNNSSQRNLKIDLQETQVLRDTGYLTNQGFKEKFTAQHVQSSSRSTKNLYSTVNKDKLLEEIDGVNHTLSKIDAKMKQAKQKNILEDTLTSKSHSNSSYQTSPKVQLQYSQQFNMQSNPNKNSQVFQKSTFSTTQQQQQQQTLNQQTLPTVRTNDYPIKKISFNQEDRESQLKRYNQKFLKQQQQEQLQESNGMSSDQVIIDFPRQIEGDKTIEQQTNTQSLIERLSKLNHEIDKLMTVKPPKRKNRVTAGHQTVKNKDSIGGQMALFQTQQQESRGRSQKSSIFEGSQHPLIEIRYNSNSNEYNLPMHQPVKKHSSSLMQKTYSSGGYPENSNQGSKGNDNIPSSRHSHAVNKDKLPHELNNILQKQQKKRQLRHGLTTCFVLPTKDSVQYVRRDLNQDTFCKINSHCGDQDNDPHTPKSNNSLRSIEKRRKAPFDALRSHSRKNLIEESKATPLRIHSNSFDDKDAMKSPCQLEAEPLQSFRKNGENEIGPNKQNFLQQQNEHMIVFNKNEIIQPIASARYEVFFDDAELKDTEDKFTSRDINFNRLKYFNNHE